MHAQLQPLPGTLPLCATTALWIAGSPWRPLEEQVIAGQDQAGSICYGMSVMLLHGLIWELILCGRYELPPNAFESGPWMKYQKC